MSRNPLVRKLMTVARLTPEDEREVEALSRNVREVPAKRDIISEGDRPDRVHLILDGWAARYKTLPDGSRQIVAFLIPGDFCDIHITILTQMDHGIVALTPCQVAYVPSAMIDELTARSPALTRAFWWLTLVDEAVLREWIVSNGRRDAFGAVAHLLCEIHLRMRMVGLVEDGRFSLPITQEEIADAAGLTPVHTNRTLQRLRAQGLIALEQRILTVVDVDGLRHAAGFDPNYLHIRRREG